MLGSVRRLGVVHTYEADVAAAPEHSQSSFAHAPAAFTTAIGPMRLVGAPTEGSVERYQGAGQAWLASGVADGGPLSCHAVASRGLRCLIATLDCVCFTCPDLSRREARAATAPRSKMGALTLRLTPTRVHKQHTNAQPNR